VVLFRANAIDIDARAKKFSMSLARLGYDVVVLSAEPDGSVTPPRHLTAYGPGGEVRVRVIGVPIGTTHRDLFRHKVAHRRRRSLKIIDWTPKDEYVTQVRELRGRVRAASRGTPRRVAALVRLMLRKARWRTQWAMDVAHRLAWRRWDDARMRSTLLATTRGMLPEIEDYAAAFAPVLDELAPDVVHAHHPVVLGTAVRAARRRRAAGQRCLVVYDAREDFAGLPVQEQGHPRRHAVLLREEARYIRAVDAVVTVSEPIAQTLARRYRLPQAPTVVLNVPVEEPDHAPGGAAVRDVPTVRQLLGLPDGVPLLIYSGAVSRARGIDILVEALPHLPGVHAVVVPVPHPHPQLPAIEALALARGVADRFHVAPPVDHDHLLHYQSGADLAVFPIRTGSANIEQALPNKLFESLHAGLPVVACDAALVGAFVREHDLGELFSFGDGGERTAPDLERDRTAAADLARAVRRALDHPRDVGGARGQQLRHHYSWQGQEGAIRDLYGSLVAPPTPDGIDVEPFGTLAVSETGDTVSREPGSDAGPDTVETAIDTQVDSVPVDGRFS